VKKPRVPFERDDATADLFGHVFDALPGAIGVCLQCHVWSYHAAASVLCSGGHVSQHSAVDPSRAARLSPGERKMRPG
jgi:hypothetical protein